MVTLPLLLPVVLFAVTLSIFVRAVRARRRLEFRARILELMAVACRRGVPLAPLLAAAMHEHTGVRLAVVTRMHAVLAGGGEVAEALEAAGDTWFAGHVVDVARVAQTTGRMGDTLAALATEDERTLEGRHRLQLALLYPLVLALMALGLYGLVSAVFAPTAFPFPVHPRGLWAFTGVWLGIIAIVTWAASAFMRRCGIRIGGRTLGVARLLRLASIFSDAGLPIPEALRRAGRGCHHHGVARGGRAVAERIEAGELSAAAWTPLRLPHAITLRLGAVRPARLQETMAELAARLVQHHERARERLLRWLQPVSIALVAGVVLLQYSLLMNVIDQSRAVVRLW